MARREIAKIVGAATPASRAREGRRRERKNKGTGAFLRIGPAKTRRLPPGAGEESDRHGVVRARE